jgi:DNA-binding LytR/AlgR family response regulator
MRIRYLIVDDEPIAHRVIEEYCKDLSFMRLEANCYDALSALTFLNDHKVDLIFLDINMPKLRGFDLLRTIAHPPQVIVTSAYQEYALEGFELSVCDYLLKPFSFERFLKAVNKAMDSLTPTPETRPLATKTSSGGSLFIKGEKKYHQVRLDDIIYIEACGNYSTVFLKRSEIITPEKISSLEKMLVSGNFIRVHRSFIVSASKIQEIEGNQIRLGKKTVPIGRVYKMNVDKFLREQSLVSKGK